MNPTPICALAISSTRKSHMKIPLWRRASLRTGIHTGGYTPWYVGLRGPHVTLSRSALKLRSSGLWVASQVRLPMSRSSSSEALRSVGSDMFRTPYSDFLVLTDFVAPASEGRNVYRDEEIIRLSSVRSGICQQRMSPRWG